MYILNISIMKFIFTDKIKEYFVFDILIGPILFCS